MMALEYHSYNKWWHWFVSFWFLGCFLFVCLELFFVFAFCHISVF